MQTQLVELNLKRQVITGQPVSLPKVETWLVCKDSSQKEILDPVKVGKTAKPQEIGLKT